MIRFILILISLGSVIGCAMGTNLVNKGNEILATSQNVLSSYKQIQFERITYGTSYSFKFDESTPIMNENGRKVFVKGFVLPQKNGSYEVTLASHKKGTRESSALVYPDIQILDQNYHIINRIPYNKFVFRRKPITDELSTVFFINNNSKGEAFLVIRNRNVSESDWTAYQCETTGITPSKIKSSPIGSMEIEFKDYVLETTIGAKKKLIEQYMMLKN